MIELSSLKTINHHAILLTHPERKELTERIWGELQHDSVAHRLFDATVLDIANARDIISWAKSAYDRERTGLVSFHTIGIPAQNALLKILEEPDNKTKFILVTSNKNDLIDTVLSRVLHHEIGKIPEKQPEDAKYFLETPPTERMKLKFVTNLLAKKDKEDRKDREAIRMFILSLSSELTNNKASSKVIRETIEVASYASLPSSSGKMLLEYLSLLLPQTR